MRAAQQHIHAFTSCGTRRIGTRQSAFLEKSREATTQDGTALVERIGNLETSCAYRPTAFHLHSYCRGSLSDLARKSMDPIALACGTAVRTLQEFLADHVWGSA